MFQSPPYIYVSKDFKLSGYYYDIWESLQSKMGFKTEFVPATTSLWHGVNANGTYLGLTGMVYYGQVDLTLVDMFLTDDRAAILDHTIVINYSPTKLFFKTPSGADINWFTFTDMFHGSVWLLMFITTIFVALILHLLFDLWESKSNLRITTIPFTGSSVMLNQGSPSEIEPKSASGRVFLLTFLVAGMVLNASFSANLMSTLSSKKIRFPFSDIDSLYRQTDFQVLSLFSSAFDEDFKVTF